ncbi:MAG: cobalamin-dependent protein [Deltaproteobacteria bacterium]|nr:cobalamin-dependent protein [Deltaproteobacteria bacterium]
MGSLRLCLVGSEQQENLGLRYLAAAAEQAGHDVTVVSMEGRAELATAAAAVKAAEPALVGLNMAFQHTVDDYLELARRLREQGFTGHLTCGGQVPTFNHSQLLDEEPALDTAVRFEGETTLVELLDALAAGRPPADLPGLVWREDGVPVVGPPRPLCGRLDELPVPKRQPEPFRIGGVPMAFVITGRGCPSDCSYCCLNAFTRAAGGASLRLRDPEAVAAEIAALRTERGVRVLVLQDDVFILPSERRAIERMDAIGAALRRRGIDDVLFWAKGRPDDITAPVLEAARRLGVIHLFLGVEHAVAERLRYLGRSHQPADNQRALQLCADHGIRPSFNLMLFDPDCALEDVAATIDFGAEHLQATWNICRTEIYSGTRLRDRLEAEGRLVGTYRSYGYQIRDERAEVMFRVLRASMQERAFACDSVINRVISLSFARQVQLALFPGGSADALSRFVDELRDDLYGDTVAVLRQALALAAEADLSDRAAIHEATAALALEVARRDGLLGQRADDLWQRLTVRGTMGLAREP